ncbi:hypothetical protein [Flectobacillus longus]|uniref:hypothetical protein n=1 Tax=Flectobacillus longus TaxID=2984207 RepID=UPI0024B87037|nr:hypothetical protein [Flectobacillus longus]MDI9882680.1 hypothetical protein [Flectobacillus longus]
MKKIIYMLILPLVVVSGLVFANANREAKDEAARKPLSKPLSIAERKAALKKWEASPDGIMFKKWEASPAGKKVYAGEAKIRKNISAFSDMEAVVTSLSLPPGSRLGFGIMVKINGDDYILSFGLEKSDNTIFNSNNEFEQLHNLKVNDKITIRSHNVSHAPKYSYPIVAGDYVEQNHKIIYKRALHQGGC